MPTVVLLAAWSLFAIGLNVVGARLTRAMGLGYPYWAPVTLLGYGIFAGLAARSFPTGTILLAAAVTAVVDSAFSTPTAWELGALPQYAEREEMGRVMRFLLPSAVAATVGAAYVGIVVSGLLS